jgi:xanthine dehydrogenase YagT iron-sulfur-binding subunit
MTRDPNDRDDRDTPERRGLSRRGFLTTMGTGVLSATAASQLPAQTAEGPQVLAAHELAKVALTINGRTHSVLVEPRWSLSYVLREVLELSGTKVGCERGECGACTVLLDGVPHYACLTLAVEAEGAEIITVEGLMDGEDLGPVQQAFLEKDAYQCGYCTSGQIMAAEGLLRAEGDPAVEHIRHGMSGNLCRCGAYPHIVMAVQRAAELRRAGGAP